MTKQQLLLEISKAEEKIEKVNANSNLSVTNRNELRRKLETNIKRLRRILYECDCCAEATFAEDKNGEEYFKNDCGKDCPYHDFFMKMDEEKEADIDRSLRYFLENA